MIQYLLEVSLCSIGFISFYYMALRDKSFHHWNRIFLNGSLVLSLLIPLLRIPIEEIIYVTEISTVPIGSRVNPAYVFPWQDLVVGIYLLGVFTMLYHFIREVYQIKNIISNSDKEVFPNYSLVKLDKEFPLCSFFNFIICDKNTLISQYELDHELTHIEQKHSYDKVFLELVKILLWFNPAIYVYQKNIHAVHEFLADENVVKLFGYNAYQEYLIQSLTNRHNQLSTVNPFHSLIKNRLHMLNNKKESTRGIFLFAIPIIACLTFFISCEKTTKVIAIDEIEKSNLKFTEEGNIILTDTISTFNEDTFEEEIKIVTRELTPEAYAKTRNELNANFNSETNSNSDLITVVDTIITFDADTFEERKRYVKTQMTPEDYEERIQMKNIQYEPFEEKSRNLNSKAGTKPTGSIINKIDLSEVNPESNFITVVDTLIYFDNKTNKEMTKILESKLSPAEYKRRQNLTSIPVGELEDNAKTLKVIEGNLSIKN